MVLIPKPVTYVQQIKDGCDYICSTSKYVKPIKYGLRIGKKGDKPNQKNTLNRTTENDIFNTRIEVNGSKRTFEQDIYKRALVQDIYNRTLVKDIHERTIEEDSYKGTFENRRKLKIVNLQCVLLCTVFEKLKSYLLQKLLNIFKNAFDTVVSLRF